MGLGTRLDALKYQRIYICSVFPGWRVLINVGTCWDRKSQVRAKLASGMDLSNDVSSAINYPTVASPSCTDDLIDESREV